MPDAVGVGAANGKQSTQARNRAIRIMWIVVDALTFVGAALLGAWVRYDFSASQKMLGSVITFAVTAGVIYVIASATFGAMHVGHVRGSFEETSDIVRAVIATAVALGLLQVFTDFFRVPRSLPLTAPLFALMMMFAIRFAVRAWRWGRHSIGVHDKRVIVFGAGNTGRALVRSLNSDVSEEARYVPVAVLDDEPRKRRLRVDGLRVSGTRADIRREADRTMADALVIAAGSIDGDDVRDISDRARAAGLDVLTLPPVTQLLRAPRVTDLRHVNLGDLLGRQQIELDQEAIHATITGKRVLITGAGGSIGSELCRQINRYGPAKLILLDRDESAMHSTQMSLTGRALLDDGTLALCDIRDPRALGRVFASERPEVVLHAAALKHLTLLEQFPAEAWKTNVIGTLNVLEASRAIGVQTFVNVSTDKAAWPSSVLGYSKRLAERLTASFADTPGATYVSVRFGNVLGSRGSVITAFTEQIEKGGPVTVTHPDVERFFMLIPEACQLVLQAAAMGADGEVMVLAMGQPVKIVDVAQQLIKMSGRTGVQIEFTGLRPGEKLSEQLFTPGEKIQSSAHPLLSHVTVPAIDPAVVREHAHMKAEDALAWMVQQSGGHRDHDPSMDIDITAGKRSTPAVSAPETSTGESA